MSEQRKGERRNVWETAKNSWARRKNLGRRTREGSAEDRACVHAYVCQKCGGFRGNADEAVKWLRSPGTDLTAHVHVFEEDGAWAEIKDLRTKLFAVEAKLRATEAVVAEQAEDWGLWFVAQTAPEAHLQAALRRLHAMVETSS